MVNNIKIPVASDDEICLGIDLEPDEWIKDSRCSKHITGNRKLFSSYKAYNGGNVIFGSNLRDNIIGKGQICDSKCKVIFSEHDSEITKDRKACSFMLCDLDFEPSSLSLSSMPSCDLEYLTNILILCLILKASNQSLRKSLSLNLELS
ncbi:hypothetical protein Tco_0949933 [Tanacetum coccineum]